MRILLVADIVNTFGITLMQNVSRVDLIISCGDLKANTSYLATMIHVPVFYVHGNHDTGYIDNPRRMTV